MKKDNSFNNQGMILKVLDWAYGKAINGFMGADSAYELANSYLNTKGTLGKQVDALVKWQVTKAGTSGFLTGLGGFAVMPFSIPANVASVIYIQIRMITAIAYMGGHDITSDKVKSLVFVSMAGNGAKEILKDMGIKAGEKVLTHVAQNASTKLLVSMNEKTSVSLASKMTSKGLSKLGKAIPFMGGIVGGAFDGITTNVVGKMAKRIFIDDNSNVFIGKEDTPLYASDH